MIKNIMAGVVLFVLAVTSWACLMPVSKVTLELPETAALRGGRIITVYTKSGSVINFDPKNPGRIVQDEVVGDVKVDPRAFAGSTRVSKSIPLSEVKLVEVKRLDTGMSFLASTGVLALICLALILLPG